MFVCMLVNISMGCHSQERTRHCPDNQKARLPSVWLICHTVCCWRICAVHSCHGAANQTDELAERHEHVRSGAAVLGLCAVGRLFADRNLLYE